MIPYNTDAPIYHLPVATVSLIVLNTVLFFAVPRSLVEPEPGFDLSIIENMDGSDFTESDFNTELDEDITDQASSLAQADNVVAMLGSETPVYPKYTLVLQHGAGVKPWQWLTSIFMHAGFMHLLFNMIALWAFGLVVEGKVGWLQFLGLYLGVGVLQSGLEQLVMCLHGQGGSLGASAAIFGILGIAIVWAPRNDFDVFFQFGFRAGSVEIPILMYGFLQFLLEAVNIAFGNFQMSSGVMHMLGFAIGIGLGFVWLVRGWVDCEGWDILTVLKGQEGRDLEGERIDREAAELVNSTHRPRSETAARTSVKTKVQETKTQSPNSNSVSTQLTLPIPPVYVQPEPSADDLADLFAAAAPAQPTSAASKLQQMIELGKHQQALRELVNARKSGTVELPQPSLARLVRDLLAAQDYNNAIPLMAEHIRRFSENRLTLQINLAKILLQRQRPQKALQVLRSIQSSSIDENARETVTNLISHAEQLIDNGSS